MAKHVAFYCSYQTPYIPLRFPVNTLMCGLAPYKDTTTMFVDIWHVPQPLKQTLIQLCKSRGALTFIKAIFTSKFSFQRGLINKDGRSE